jgi:hypothetical protein
MEWLKDWAQVIGAGITLLAVLVALGIGIASILHTRSIQKKERKERLLNEIIEWAADILTFSPMPKHSIFELKMKEEEPKIEDVIQLWRLSLQENLMPIISKGAYINRISKTLGKSIGSATKKASLQLSLVVGDINKLDKKVSSLKALGKSHEKLHATAIEIVEEATKLKTRDIS